MAGAQTQHGQAAAREAGRGICFQHGAQALAQHAGRHLRQRRCKFILQLRRGVGGQQRMAQGEAGQGAKGDEFQQVAQGRQQRARIAHE